MAFVSRLDPTLTFPTLAVCSDDGVRRGKMKQDLGLHGAYWTLGDAENDTDWKWPQDKTELNEWYSGSTFSKREVVKNIR